MTEKEFINAKDLGALNVAALALSEVCAELQPNINEMEFKEVVAKIESWKAAIRATVEFKE